MRYTHHFHIIRKRKHTTPIAIFVGLLITTLIFLFGFNQLDATQFLLGFILSFNRVVVAYIISIFLALIISLFVTSNKQLEDISLPILDVLQSFPSFAILPLLIALFHHSELIIILILVLAMIWPILFSILGGIKALNSELLEAAQIYNARGLKGLIFVTIPLIESSIVTGSIVAWGEAWETVLASEIIIKVTGIGTYLTSAGESQDSKVLIIGILLLMAILFILNKLFWIPLLNKSTTNQ